MKGTPHLQLSPRPRGPELPWTALVSTSSNLVIHSQAGPESLQSRISQPLKHEFEVELAGGFQARIRLHMPPEQQNNECPRLLLRLGERQDGQLVNAEFDGLSLTTYLTTVRGYAVLYVRTTGFLFWHLLLDECVHCLLGMFLVDECSRQ